MNNILQDNIEKINNQELNNNINYKKSYYIDKFDNKLFARFVNIKYIYTKLNETFFLKLYFIVILFFIFNLVLL